MGQMVYRIPTQTYFYQKSIIGTILTIINHIMNHYFTTIDHIKHHFHGGWHQIGSYGNFHGSEPQGKENQSVAEARHRIGGLRSKSCGANVFQRNKNNHSENRGESMEI